MMSSEYHESQMAALAKQFAKKLIALEKAKGEIRELEEKLRRLDKAMSIDEIQTLFTLQARQGEITPPKSTKKKGMVPIFDYCYVQTDPPGPQRINHGPIVLAEYNVGKERLRVNYRITFVPFIPEE